MIVTVGVALLGLLLAESGLTVVRAAPLTVKQAEQVEVAPSVLVTRSPRGPVSAAVFTVKRRSSSVAVVRSAISTMQPGASPLRAHAVGLPVVVGALSVMFGSTAPFSSTSSRVPRAKPVPLTAMFSAPPCATAFGIVDETVRAWELMTVKQF